VKKKDRKDKTRYKSKLRKQQSKRPGADIEEDDLGVSDETAEIMKREMEERYGVEHKVIRDRTLEKMSDILLEYGKPLLDTITSDSKAEYEKAITILITLWNCSIMQGGPKGRRGIEKMLKPVMPDAESKSVVRYMLDRKLQLYSDNKRFITNYELSETPDGFHLVVMSTIPKPSQ
jgi:hypothetical protein